ncbi:FBP domain-containing protein [Geodermatophilus dictyosporus]|nr:FBP domain-containing protein [Geodermatophilus dictyosporus]
MTEQQVRRSLVDCAKGEADSAALRAAESRMSARRSVVCLLCRSTHSGDAVSLFTARRAGAAGRNGDTVGTYVCADLGCAARARTEIPPWLRDRDPVEVGEERVAELRERVAEFVDAVRR